MNNRQFVIIYGNMIRIEGRYSIMSKRKNKRKASVFFRLLSLIFSFVLIIFTIILIGQIIRLNLLPLFYVIPISIIIGSLSLLFIILMLFKAQRGFLHFVLTLVIIALTCVYGTGNYFVYVTSKAFKSVTNLTSKVSNTLTVRTLEGRAQSEKDLDGACLGYFTSMDSSDLSKLTDSLSKDNVSFTAKAYDDIYDMVQDLYDGYIDGILFNESYSGVVTAVEEYSMFVNRTTPVYSMTYYTENQNQKQDSINDVDVTSVPFTVMISGNDSYGQFNENSRSDMNMLVTVNPNTGTVLMTSIPRDYYVPIAGLTNGYDDAELEDKLTHSGLYGIETTQKTIENLLDVDINYYIRVNFSSLINLVDAIGGIDVYVEEGLAVDAFYADTTLGGVSEGWNHLDGKRALAFSRERHAYQYGDNQRVKNQQIVLEAIIHSLTKPSMILNYPKFISALSGAFETNMPADTISNLLKFEFGTFPDWKFESYALSGFGDSRLCASLGGYADVVLPDEESVIVAKEKINLVEIGNTSNDIE